MGKKQRKCQSTLSTTVFLQKLVLAVSSPLAMTKEAAMIFAMLWQIWASTRNDIITYNLLAFWKKRREAGGHSPKRLKCEYSESNSRLGESSCQKSWQSSKQAGNSLLKDALGKKGAGPFRAGAWVVESPEGPFYERGNTCIAHLYTGTSVNAKAIYASVLPRQRIMLSLSLQDVRIDAPHIYQDRFLRWPG